MSSKLNCSFSRGLVAPPGELQVNAGVVVWLAGNTVWSTPERTRGEVLTTMRYTNRRFPFTFTFIVTCFLLLTRFGVSNRYVMCLLCCVCERASLWTFRLDEVWYGKMVKGSRLALSTASHQVFTQRLRVRKRYSLVMIKGEWCNVKKTGLYGPML